MTKGWATGFLFALAAAGCAAITGLDEFEVASATATAGSGGDRR